MKALLVQSSQRYDDGYNTIGIYLDINKGKEFVEQMNIEYFKESNEINMCYKCNETNLEDEVYKLRETCSRACIKTDRHGEYCENEKGHYDMINPHYSGEEVEILG